MKKMEILIVGGAVRDELLGLEVNDEDFLVVHGTPEHFLNLGYENVGNDFPVFLHPETKDEYALARTERKIGVGYNGFETNFDPTVTVEEDLFRRDLTINAIARRQNGELVDPYGGVEDLNNKVLRHVSDHFSEDPVRVLRIARFMSRYSELGFTIHSDTMDLMKNMVLAGELHHLTSERVFKELEKTFKEPTPSKFFEVLKECGALAVVFPEIDALFGVPQVEKYHPEIDTGVHTLMVLDQSAKISNNDPEIMFAALLHDLGKAVTYEENVSKVEEAEKNGKELKDASGRPITKEAFVEKHLFHEEKGVDLVIQVCDRLKVPNSYRKLAVISCEQHLKMHNILEFSNKPLLELYIKLDAFKNEEMIDKFAKVCEADSKGRTGFENRPYPQSDYIKHCFEFIRETNSQVFIDKGIKGKEIGEAIKLDRINRLTMAKKLYPTNLDKKTKEWEHILKDPKNINNSELLRFIKSLSVGKDIRVLKHVLDTSKINKSDKAELENLAHNVLNINAKEYLDKGLKNIEVGLAIENKKNEFINLYKKSGLKHKNKIK